MSQHDMDLANAAGATFRADLNNALVALAGNSSGATTPSTTYAYQFWADTTSGWLKQRNAANSAWIKVLPLAGGARVDVASASTLDLDANAVTSDYLRITGTTSITAVTLTEGQRRYALAGGAFTITHGASLIVPGSANYTTTAGDLILFLGEAAGVVRVMIWKSDGTPVVSSTSAKVQDFRLTLTTGTPVTTSDVTGATTIYCTPYKGNQISLYSGSAWVTRSSAEFSLALGTLTSGKPYDVFCYDNGGTPTLEFLVWTDDTTRATALTYQDGVLVKSGATTRRYLGTFYTTATTTTEDSKTKRYLWNYYHRVQRYMLRQETTASWTYTTATWRQANASTSNQLNFVIGVSEDAVSADVNARFANSSANIELSVGVGLDSTSTNSSDSAGCSIQSAGNVNSMVANYNGVIAAGRHYLAWLEISRAAGTSTWYGQTTSAGVPLQSTISGRMFS